LARLPRFERRSADPKGVEGPAQEHKKTLKAKRANVRKSVEIIDSPGDIIRTFSAGLSNSKGRQKHTIQQTEIRAVDVRKIDSGSLDFMGYSKGAGLTLQSSVMSNFLFFAFLLLLTAPGQIFADVPYRVTDRRHLRGPLSEERFVRVAGAKVAYFDRQAIERDFEFLKGQTDEQIESWILGNFAFVSRAQLELNGIRQSNVPLVNPFRRQDVRIGFRPLNYNRAAVFPTLPGMPFVDVKGVGLSHSQNEKIFDQIRQFTLSAIDADVKRLDRLRTKDHSDGLMSLGEAIAELTRQQAAQLLFEELNKKPQLLPRQTIETYFIIALPFSVLKDKGQSIPAALYGRQAHYGRSSNYEVPEEVYIDDHGRRQSDILRTAAVDFGGVLITDPRVNENFISDPPNANTDPQESRAWAWGHDVAKAFMAGHKHAVYHHVAEMVGPLRSMPRSKISRFTLDQFVRRYVAVADLESKRRFVEDHFNQGDFEILGSAAATDHYIRGMLDRLLHLRVQTLRNFPGSSAVLNYQAELASRIDLEILPVSKSLFDELILRAKSKLEEELATEPDLQTERRVLKFLLLDPHSRPEDLVTELELIHFNFTDSEFYSFGMQADRKLHDQGVPKDRPMLYIKFLTWFAGRNPKTGWPMLDHYVSQLAPDIKREVFRSFHDNEGIDLTHVSATYLKKWIGDGTPELK